MSDYRRLVDDIQSVLYSVSCPVPDTLRRLVAEYGGACERVNQRLRRCEHLLAQGLRSEAIQLAEVDPNLLQSVTTLDFPELPQFLDVLAEQKLPGPPVLQLEAAAELNAAYAAEQPLAALLRIHRMLAIARAGMLARIQTLRQIARRDVGNPIWLQDLAAYEQCRFDELERESREAYQQNDLERLRALRVELAEQPWLAPPATALVAKVDERFRRREREAARQTLESLVDPLNQAHALLDVDAGRTIREQWTSAAEAGQLTEGDSLLEFAAPALEWLSQEDALDEIRARSERANENLREVLRRPRSTARELRSAYAAAAAFDSPVPEDLEVACGDFLARVARRRRRRTWLAVAGGVVGVVLSVLTTDAWLSNRRYRSEVAEFSRRLADLVESNQLDSATQALVQLRDRSPRSLEEASIRRIETKLRKKIGEERDRSGNWTRLFTEIRIADDLPDVNVVVQLKALTRTADEQSSLEEALRQIEQRIAARREAVDKAFRGRVQQLAARIVPPSLADVVDWTGLEAQFATWTGEAETLRRDGASMSVSSHCIRELDDLTARLDSSRAEFVSHQKQRNHEDRLTEAVGNRLQYVAEIRRRVAEDPQEERTSELAAVLGDDAIWRGVDAWNSFIDQWNRVDRTTLDAREASKLLQELRRLVSEHPAFAPLDGIDAFGPHLEAIAARGEGRVGPLVQETVAMFSSPLMIDSRMFRNAEGAWYTLEKTRRFVALESSPDKYSGNMNCMVFASGKTINVPFTFERPREAVVGEGGLRIATNGHAELSTSVAPQARLSPNAISLLQNITDQDWERTYCKLLRMILMEAELDDVLRLALLRISLTNAGAGSHSIKSSFREILQDLEAPTLDLSVRWMDPRDATANSMRAFASVLLKRMRPTAWDDTTKNAAEQLRKFRAFTGTRVEWVGWLKRSPSGAGWSCHLGKRQFPPGSLLLLVPTAGSSSQLRVIGRYDGSARIAASSSSGFMTGRPVFLRVSEKISRE